MQTATLGRYASGFFCGGVFDGFKMDALNAEGYALYIDFLEFIEEKIRKSRNQPGCGRSSIEKLAFIFF